MGTVDLRHLRRTAAVVLTTSLLAGALAACGDDAVDSGQHVATYDAAVSTPQRDSIYRGVGNDTVDVLHYDLDLTWDPARRRLSGVETITLRGTERADRIVLDLDRGLRPDAVEVDGAPVEAERTGIHLEIPGHISPARRTVVRLEYSGVPSGVRAPTQRGTLAVVGWNVSGDGEVTTVQQPYGAFTWYAVNDTPSDKAFHDVTLRVPEKWVGISNGTLEERSVEDGLTVTRWHGSAPAAPSSMTVAIGDYVAAEAETASGVPVMTWTAAGDTLSADAMTKVPAIVEWLEQKLGAYPFDAVGAVVIPEAAGSPTQETITVPTTPNSRTEVALVDGLAHQWFGNAVTPADWKDLWLAEGVPFYLADGLWGVEHHTESWSDVVARWRGGDRLHRRASGAPTAYARDNFGPASVEYGAALMWRELADLVEGSGGLAKGEETGSVFTDMSFTDLLSDFVDEHTGASVTREDVVSLLRRNSRLDYTAFLAAWLDGGQTPPAGTLASAPITGH